MRFIIVAHPSFLKSESMPRYAQMLQNGLTDAGHRSAIIQPKPYCYRAFKNTGVAKWAGYIDQYLIFALSVAAADLCAPRDTLFIFSDQALGPLVPYVRRHKKVVHCHDFMALKSALGHYPENETGISGKIYQKYIRWGFKKCHNFISVSRQTAVDLEAIGEAKPRFSKVIYNGLNYPFRPIEQPVVASEFAHAGLTLESGQYLLFIGGEQWYKNRKGLLLMYKAYLDQESRPLPLVCVSPEPKGELAGLLRAVRRSVGTVHFLQNVSPTLLQALYSGARLMIFPSIAEGFGWPIIEAQACGCPVLTTDDAPMTEIAGPVARFLPRLSAETDIAGWAAQGAVAIQLTLNISEAERQKEKKLAIEWAGKFEQAGAIAAYLSAYAKIADPPV